MGKLLGSLQRLDIAVKGDWDAKNLWATQHQIQQQKRGRVITK